MDKRLKNIVDHFDQMKIGADEPFRFHCTMCGKCCHKGRMASKPMEIEKVPIHLKMTLTIKEAAEYSNIGINKIDSMLRDPNCPFVLYIGAKRMVKRKEFEEFIREQMVI